MRRNATATRICTAGRRVRRPTCFRTGYGTSGSDGSSAYERSHRRCRLRGYVPSVLLSMSRATWVPPLWQFLGPGRYRTLSQGRRDNFGGRSTEAGIKHRSTARPSAYSCAGALASQPLNGPDCVEIQEKSRKPRLSAGLNAAYFLSNAGQNAMGSAGSTGKFA